LGAAILEMGQVALVATVIGMPVGCITGDPKLHRDLVDLRSWIHSRIGEVQLWPLRQGRGRLVDPVRRADLLVAAGRYEEAKALYEAVIHRYRLWSTASNPTPPRDVRSVILLRSLTHQALLRAGSKARWWPRGHRADILERAARFVEHGDRRFRNHRYQDAKHWYMLAQEELPFRLTDDGPFAPEPSPLVRLAVARSAAALAIRRAENAREQRGRLRKAKAMMRIANRELDHGQYHRATVRFQQAAGMLGEAPGDRTPGPGATSRAASQPATRRARRSDVAGGGGREGGV